MIDQLFNPSAILYSMACFFLKQHPSYSVPTIPSWSGLHDLASEPGVVRDVRGTPNLHGVRTPSVERDCFFLKKPMKCHSPNLVQETLPQGFSRDSIQGETMFYLVLTQVIYGMLS